MIPVAFAAQAAGGPAEMRFACAKKDGGLLRHVKRAGECRTSTERLIRFRDGDQVVACAHRGGYVYLVGKRAACKSERHAPSLTLRLPSGMEHSFCANKQTGLLRSTRHAPYSTPRPRVFTSACRPDEKRVFVDERNRSPRAEDDSATIGEDAAAGIDVLANDSDPDDDALEVLRVIPGAISGSVAIAADRGSVSYDPSGRFEALGAGARATETFRYKATDGRRKDRARVTVTVQGANDAPRAAADAGSTNEDAATTIAVLGNDSDVDAGDVLSVTAVDTTGTAGAVTINPGGTLRYDPAGRLDDLRAGEQRIDRFAYRISDGHGGTAGATVSITVSGLGDAATIDTTDSALAVTEGDGPALVDGALTVADPDDTSLERARVEILNDQPGDKLIFADQSGITGSYSGGVLTLEGASSVANYQAALRSIRFEHTGDDPAAAKTVEFRADDGDGLGPAATRDVAVIGVNDEPAVNTSPGSASFTEGDAPVAVDPDVDVSDADSALLSGATVAIAPHPAEDSLTVASQNGISGSYDPGTGVLTLTGSATAASYESALRSVTYDNSSNDPSTATRIASFEVTDAGGLDSNVDTRDIDVAGANDAPVVTTSAGPTAYVESDPAVAVDGALTVTDADDSSLEGATVEILSDQPGDELLFTDQNGITTGSNSAGVLTLTGTASVADYQTALRSVRYRHTGDDPATSKTIEFIVDDGDSDSSAASKSIGVTPVNDAPTVDTTDAPPLAYPEGAGPLAADFGVTLTDPDSTQIAFATVQITSNFNSGQDELEFADQLGITGVYDDNIGLLRLLGTASVADYQAALRAVTYENSSDDPSPPARTLTFEATDFEGATSAPATRDVTHVTANDAATITTSGGALAYTEGDPPTPVDSALTVSDPDDGNLEGARVRISAGFEAGDDLLFVNQLGITGGYDGAGVLTLTGTASVAAYQTALRSIAFSATSDNPSTPKTVEFSADDGDGLGPASVRNIAVTGVDDAPTVTASGGSASFTEGGGPVAVDNNLTVTDPDSATLSGATVEITSNLIAAEDVLAFVDTADITGDYDDTNGLLTLSGDASPADYQAALRSVTYENSSHNPSTATRTVSFQVSGSNTAMRNVTVAGTNDAPVVTTSGGSTGYTEGAPAVAVDGALTVTDVDDTNLESATVRISAGFDSGDLLLLADQSGITDSYDSVTGVLTLTGSAPVGNYEAALRLVEFRSTHDNPASTKTVEFTTDDGDVDSLAATKAITVTRVNDGPQITTTGSSLAYTENDGAVAIDGGLTLTDPDSTQIEAAQVTIGTSNHRPAQDELGFVDQGTITHVYDDTNGVLSLSGDASVADYQAALRSVTYTNVSEGPDPLTRTISFQAVDDESAVGNSATRGISITGVNDPPAAAPDTGNTDEDTTLNVSAPGVLANDTDVDPGDTKTVDRLNGSATLTGTSAKGAAVTINADGSYTYNPGSIFQGLSTGQQDMDSFSYRMTDGGGASATATVSLTIEGVSDAPTANPDSFDAIGNTALSVGTSRPAGEAGKVITGSVLTNDTDPDTPQADLVAQPVTDAATTLDGKITIEADGNFTYHPQGGDTGTDTFTYTVSDGVESSTGTLTLPIAGQVWYVRNDTAPGGDGTSDGPFDTLAEAETASGTGDTVYIFDGDNTATNLHTGFAMEADERLIGEHSGVSLASHTLHLGTTNAHPTLTATNEDVVALDDGNVVRGFNIDADGTGGGIAGGSGDTGGGTIDDVNIVDSGTTATEPALDLDATTGTFNISNLVVNSNSTGVRLNNAGTVNFSPASQISITSNGAPGVSALGTNMGTSTFDDITVTNSGGGGVSMSNATGTTTFGDGSGVDLALSTTSGATPAFGLANAGTITVGTAGVDNVSANGGPAIDVTGTSGPALAFDDVDSTGSVNDGINLVGLGTGTFSATTGTIAGAAGIAFDLDGGSGDVTYPGDLNNGSGQSAEITGRNAGAVTLSGPIADTGDAGGGISLSGNTGGSTTFSNASKVLSTTTSDALSFTNSDGHTLTLTNGLAVNTTSGQGIVATTSGTINVANGVNTVTSTTGRAVNVQNTDIGGSGFTFQSVSSNGAPNGILLNSTGTSAGMTITGTGANNSGGTIQNATQHGVSLTTTNNFNADELSITGANFAGVDGTDVTNFTFTDGEILNAGDSLSDPLHGAIAFNDQAGNENNVDGTLTVTGNLLKDHYGGGVDVFNRNGTLNDATVSNNTIDSPANEALSKEDAISFNLFGSASTVASLTKAQIEDNVITDHPSGNGITILGAQTNTGAAPTPTVGQPGSSTNRILIDGNLLTGDPVLRFGGSGIQAGIEGRGQGNFDITNNGTALNPITNVGTHGIATGNGGNSNVEYLIQNNRVTANNFEAGAIGIRSASDKHIMADLTTLATPTLKTIIDSNVVRNTTGSGIRVLASNSNGTADVKVTNNDVANGGAGTAAIRVENGSSADPAFDPTMCATISNNTTAANAPTAGGHTFPGIALFKRSSVAANYQFGITGGLAPSPAPNATTETFVTTLNPNSNLGAGFYVGKRVTVDAGDNFVSCTHPAGF